MERRRRVVLEANEATFWALRVTFALTGVGMKSHQHGQNSTVFYPLTDEDRVSVLTIEREHIGMIVISTHGISGSRPLVFGSIAEKCAASTPQS
jgi:hypothetical protein